MTPTKEGAVSLSNLLSASKILCLSNKEIVIYNLLKSHFLSSNKDCCFCHCFLHCKKSELKRKLKAVPAIMMFQFNQLEEPNKRPWSTVFISKLASEDIVWKWHEISKNNSIVLQFFNTFLEVLLNDRVSKTWHLILKDIKKWGDKYCELIHFF